MKKLTQRVVILVALSATTGWSSMLVRVRAPAAALPAGTDIAGSRPGRGTDVIVDRGGLTRLAALGLKTEIIIPDVDRYLRTAAVNYRTLAKIEAFIDSVATAYPAIAKKSALGTTFEGRTIWALEISKNAGVDEGEPELLFMGLHHAREWPTVEICLFFADTLLRGYGKDPAVTAVVDSRRIWIVPCLNPDGYYYCHDLGHDWRKNRRLFPETMTRGVDLNRNYNASSDGVDQGQWGSINGSNTTHFSAYETYCGPEPFSEAETRAVRDFVLARNLVFSVSYHTYSELVLWPWGYDPVRVSPDDQVLKTVGERMAALISSDDGSRSYLPQQAAFLYPATGDADDWLYGFSYYRRGKNLLPYTVEACSDFQPSPVKLGQIVRANFAGAFYVCQIADSIRQLLKPAVVATAPTGPDTASGRFDLDWGVNDRSDPSAFEVEALAGEIVLDSAASEAGWVLRNFSVSAKNSHSKNASFHSFENGSNMTGSATTAEPVPLMPGDSLVCWVNYDIEANYDYASVEVSADGRDWNILEGFTGTSDWTRKAYSLEPWLPGSVYIRFRYTVDQATNGEGFYVDDISPVARYRTITSLSSSIGAPPYTVGQPDTGIWFYRVRGRNSRGWGDFSPLKRVVVTAAGAAETGRLPGDRSRFEWRQQFGRGRFAVRYELGRDSRVRISVYDPSGRLVAVPVDRDEEAGLHGEQVRLPLPAGIYFIRFTAGGFSATGKILIVR